MKMVPTRLPENLYKQIKQRAKDEHRHIQQQHEVIVELGLVINSNLTVKESEHEQDHKASSGECQALESGGNQTGRKHRHSNRTKRAR